CSIINVARIGHGVQVYANGRQMRTSCNRKPLRAAPIDFGSGGVIEIYLVIGNDQIQPAIPVEIKSCNRRRRRGGQCGTAFLAEMPGSVPPVDEGRQFARGVRLVICDRYVKMSVSVEITNRGIEARVA